GTPMGLDGSRPARSGRWASPWPSRAGILALLAILAPAIGPVAGQEEAKPRPPSRPDLTDPVVCLTVEGFRNLVARDEPELTRDEKLQIYYEPFNYVIVRDAGEGG